MINTIIHGDCFQHFHKLADKSINLVILDPPYYRIKGAFDFELSFNQWKRMHEKLASEIYRLLTRNGSLFVFGHAKNIAYQQIVFDRKFSLINSLVWEKKECRTKKGIANFRSFAPVTERILFYSKEKTKNELGQIHDNPKCFKNIKTYMNTEKERIKKKFNFKTEKAFNSYINKISETTSEVSSHYFSNHQYHFPTEKIYKKLGKTGFFQKPYIELRHEYEEKRRKYEEKRRTFNNIYRLTDVLKFSQQSHLTKKYDHPTQKPEFLIRALIETCTKENDVVLDCMAGSGVVGRVCQQIKRNFILIEENKNYYDIICKRLKQPIQTEINL